jgi:hypothetical protein
MRKFHSFTGTLMLSTGSLSCISNDPGTHFSCVCLRRHQCLMRVRVVLRQCACGHTKRKTEGFVSPRWGVWGCGKEFVVCCSLDPSRPQLASTMMTVDLQHESGKASSPGSPLARAVRGTSKLAGRFMIKYDWRDRFRQSNAHLYSRWLEVERKHERSDSEHAT